MGNTSRMHIAKEQRRVRLTRKLHRVVTHSSGAERLEVTNIPYKHKNRQVLVSGLCPQRIACEYLSFSFWVAALTSTEPLEPTLLIPGML